MISQLANRVLPTALDGQQGSLFIAGTVISVVAVWFVNELFRYRIR